MIDYKGQLNMGNEALQSEKTITANEVLRTCDTKALAREISHQNALIPEQVAAAVLENFCKAAAEKMAEGFAIHPAERGRRGGHPHLPRHPHQGR